MSSSRKPFGIAVASVAAVWLAAGVATARTPEPSPEPAPAKTSVKPATAASSSGAAAYRGIGRTATPKEVAAWDIDVRPDFKGLPKGSGSAADGMAIWETKCESCHGVFGEANEVFAPLVGGTTKEDVKTGRVARLTDPAYPGRTTMMKVPTISTLWDYIHRAMPWNAPKSLKPDEVYAVTAYLLNLAGVVPDDHVLSDANIAQTQALIPNRNGMTTDHALWPGKGFGNARPDVRATACMKDCAAEPSVASLLPDFARNAHGNLAEQSRPVGAQHGVDTSGPAGAAVSAPAAPAAPAASAAAPASPSTTAPATQPAARPAAAATPTPATASAGALPTRLLQAHNCLACHGVDRKIVGPAFTDVAKKYAGQAGAADLLAKKIREGSSGVWGPIPMPPQSLPAADAQTLARWLADGGKR